LTDPIQMAQFDLAGTFHRSMGLQIERFESVQVRRESFCRKVKLPVKDRAAKVNLAFTTPSPDAWPSTSFRSPTSIDRFSGFRAPPGRQPATESARMGSIQLGMKLTNLVW
jgi:hypothetical protein